MARKSFQRGSVTERRYKSGKVYILQYRIRRPGGGWIQKSETLRDCPDKKTARRKIFKPWRPRRAQEGAWAAVCVMIEQGAGVSTGEAMGLLDTDEGRALLQEGLQHLGDFIAEQML